MLPIQSSTRSIEEKRPIAAALQIGCTRSRPLRGHEAIFRCTVNSVSKFFLNSCTCAHSVRSRKPLCGPSRSKEKCAQCMTDPRKFTDTLRECSGVHGGARLCRYLVWTSVDMTGFTVKTEIYYLLAMGRYGPLRSDLDLI